MYIMIIQVTGHQFDDKEELILDKEEQWFERRVGEAIYERIKGTILEQERRIVFSNWLQEFVVYHCKSDKLNENYWT